MLIKNALASVAVKDLSLSIKWYEKLFGCQADSMPMPEVAEWKFELGGWIQVYQNKERMGSSSVTFSVNNLSEQITALKNLGIDPGPQMNNDKVKAVMIKDPDGNSIAFAEALDPNIAK
ncbi:VOC family protein [Crenothrix sp.]|uniref:VOC family protein n=1 Tax=Crenothrix sp. TaxID=3100433 RepID=UPI00374D07E1